MMRGFENPKRNAPCPSRAGRQAVYQDGDRAGHSSRSAAKELLCNEVCK